MWIIHKHNTSDNLTKKLCIGVHNSPTRALRKNVGEWQPTKGKQRTSRRINDTVDRYNNQQARVVRINNIRGNPRTTYVLPSQCWPRWWLWWLRPQRQWSCASKDRVSWWRDVLNGESNEPSCLSTWEITSSINLGPNWNENITLTTYSVEYALVLHQYKELKSNSPSVLG